MLLRVTEQVAQRAPQMMTLKAMEVKLLMEVTVTEVNDSCDDDGGADDFAN